MKTMSSTKEQDFEKKLKAFHRRSSRHVLVLETTMSHKDKCKVFHYADLIRKAGNELVAIMNNHLKQLCNCSLSLRRSEVIKDPLSVR